MPRSPAPSTVAAALKGVRAGQIFYVPGDNDVFLDGGKEYLARYGKGAGPDGRVGASE